MTTTVQVAIVTGGAGGVGAACATLLARRGYHVVVGYRSNALHAEQVASVCRAQGVQAVAVHADVSQDADCSQLAQAAMDQWGRLDALVNAAGTTQFVPLTELDAVQSADFQRIFAVNAVGPFQMARAAHKYMGDDSAIVNISSIAGETGRGSSYPYVLSKAALNALTLSLARSLAPKTRVNAVLPGMIEGNWMRNGLGDAAYQRVKNDFSELSALQKISQPEDIAKAVVWLLEPGSVVTGQLIKVDAGFTIGRDRNQSR